MSFDEIKQLINGEGEKLIFIENGKPAFVLLNFNDYKKINCVKKNQSENRIMPQFEDMPLDREMKSVSEIIAEKQAQMMEKQELPMDFNLEQDFPIEEPEMPGQELTLEDLPF